MTSPKEALRPTQPTPLLDGVRALIEATRRRVAATVNTELTMLYWQIGKHIREELLRGERAEYGEQIVSTLSRQLVAEYGRGFSYPSLTRMVNFAELLPDSEIVASLSQQLSWTHFIQLLPLKQPLQLDASGIHVAEYLTELPPKALFEEKLHQAVLIARERFEDRKALKEPCA